MTCRRTHRNRHVAGWLVLVAGVGLAVTGVRAAVPTAAQARDAVAWCAIRRLRADLHLANPDLATLACTGPQTTTLLTGVAAA